MSTNSKYVTKNRQVITVLCLLHTTIKTDSDYNVKENVDVPQGFE
jgi:hypothetical protein